MGEGHLRIKAINEVLPDQGMTQVPEAENSFFRAAYEDNQSKGVKIGVTRDRGPDSGSGFYVLDGTFVVTNAHVVNNSRTIEVRGDDGQVRKANIIKLDDTGDLALLQVQGLRPDPRRAVNVFDHSMVYQDDTMASLGVPGFKNLEQFLSPMQVADSVSVGEIFEHTHAYERVPGQPPGIGSAVAEAANSPDAAVRQDAQDYLSAPRTVFFGSHKPGMSGGQTVGADGKFAGVNDMVFGDRFHSKSGAIIPGSEVDTFLSKQGKFTFNYDRVSNFDLRPVPVLAEHTGTMAAAFLPKVRKFAPALVGAYRGYQGIDALKGYLNEDNNDELRSQYGRQFASDMGSAGGGMALSLSLLEKAPAKLRVIGMVAGGATYLASEAYNAYTDFRKDTSYLKDVKRKDGSTREPFLWRF